MFFSADFFFQVDAFNNCKIFPNLVHTNNKKIDVTTLGSSMLRVYVLAIRITDTRTIGSVHFEWNRFICYNP